MIIQKCDICLREVDNLNTIVLYKQPIEYCNKCNKKVEELAKEFKKEIDFENTVLDATLKQREKTYISDLKRRVKKK